MKSAWALLCVTLLSGSAWEFGQRDGQFRARADLVGVHATALDSAGHLVTDLAAADFEILDNGQVQPIAAFARHRQPITIVLMLDRSGSMAPHHELVREAAEAMVRHLGPDDRARIGSFGYQVRLAPETFTSDQDALVRILRTGLESGGPTPLWRAASEAMQALSNEDGRRVLVLLSDGRDTPEVSPAAVSFRDVLDRARRADVMVYAIGLTTTCGPGARLLAPDPRPPIESLAWQRRGGPIGRPGRGRIPVPRTPGGILLPPRGPVLPPARPGNDLARCRPALPDPDLRRLAADGGGGYFELDRADDLAATFARVAEELRHQYLLAFVAPARDGVLHTLEVRARRAGLQVRARTSYLAPTN